MRKIAHDTDRRALTSAAVAVGVIGILTAVSLTMDHSRPTGASGIVQAAETAAQDPTTASGTTSPTTETPPPSETDDPGAAHIEPATIPDGPLGIPGIALDAYHRATDRLTIEKPECEMDWTILAGIGQVESNQGRGRFDAQGNTIGRILGPRLDGSLPGTAVITDTDGGRFDGDTEYDRAVGPVQFIPSTWAVLGRDGNGDGVADPNNIYDGALAAATLLCGQGGSMGDPAARTRAILAYNNSLAYVANVNAWAHGYAVNAYPLPADLPEIHKPEPIVEPPATPEHCPDGWVGRPTAPPAPPRQGEPGEPGAPVPGCTEVTPTPAPPTEPAPPSPSPSPENFPAPRPPAPPAQVAPAPPALPVFELPCIAPFCAPPPA
ncbi:hypothetical protein CEY15_10100 [Dietzia natronolimnaea]|uniref:Transglycosylase SLT domain-containing protein n=1 Tax=Dietzia natronolimnaea TaxID=161920 RepID=A0A2A2WPK6_9ACTN|nr:hypothetical protein CEY15_10100 [Dietzia natronolimnaea]